MAKVKNISGDDRIVPELGRFVMQDQVVEVPDHRVVGYVAQEAIWAPVDKTAKDALALYLNPPERQDEPAAGTDGSDE